ncbi:Hypothetical predicted protein [Lecanosticta acicola]|uniref:Uncharacterized protein n=1 Tax=Lecanosticta acicola TaxID=111012 RepID=A0AAI8YRU2_9PEZI|nr:Hypothetical predicted protein [Lecanosticta acicola]
MDNNTDTGTKLKAELKAEIAQKQKAVKKMLKRLDAKERSLQYAARDGGPALQRLEGLMAEAAQVVRSTGDLIEAAERSCQASKDAALGERLRVKAFQLPLLMPFMSQRSILQLLIKAGERLDDSQAKWNDTVRSARANLSQEPQIKPHTTLPDSITILADLVQQTNTRRNFLEAHHHSFFPPPPRTVFALLSASHEPRISTETREWNLRRNMARAEHKIRADLGRIKVGEDGLLLAINAFRALRGQLLAQQQAPELVTLSKLVDAVERVEIAFREVGDEMPLNIEMLVLGSSVADGRKVIGEQEELVLRFLHMLRDIGIKMGRQRMITEFFHRV